jgi:hypothetical protein
MLKFVVVAGLVGLMLPVASAPVLAQVGSPHSCQALEKANPTAYAQLCGAYAGEFPDSDTPILGGEDAEEENYCDVHLLLPSDFKAGDRVHVAIDCGPY